MAPDEEMLAKMELYGELTQSKLELAINWIMIEMTKAKDNSRVCFCDLEGNKFHGVKAAEDAIDRGEFCACVTDKS